jgi:predicted glycosyltransferase
VRRLAREVTVLVSDEGNDLDLAGFDARPFDLHPARIHDALATADLLVADTQTMVTEAALLGTPAVRSNSFVGEDDMGNFKELESAGLIFNVSEFDETLATAERLLADESTEREWKRRRDAYVSGMVDLTSVVVEVALTQARMEAVTGVSPKSDGTPTS